MPEQPPLQRTGVVVGAADHPHGGVQVEAWITKYDQDMEEKDREITALRAIYEEERKELMHLEEYFNRLSE